MRVVRLTVLFAAMFAARVHASPPIGVVVSGGVGNAKADEYDRHFQHAYQLDVGFRTDPGGFVGVHVGAGSPIQQDIIALGSMSDRLAEYRYTPAQLGITVHRELADSIWVAPWVGVQSGWRRLACETVHDRTMVPATSTTSCDFPGRDKTATRFALGLSFGRDLFEERGHRFGFVATLSYAARAEDHASQHGDSLGSAYTSFLVGFGYRYWGR